MRQTQYSMDKVEKAMRSRLTETRPFSARSNSEIIGVVGSFRKDVLGTQDGSNQLFASHTPKSGRTHSEDPFHLRIVEAGAMSPQDQTSKDGSASLTWSQFNDWCGAEEKRGNGSSLRRNQWIQRNSIRSYRSIGRQTQ